MAQYIILFLIAFVLWGGALLHPVDVIPSQNIYPFYNIIGFWLGDNKILFSVIGFVLLLFEALLINSIITESEIVPKNSLLPGFLYIILMSFSPELLTLHPVLIANLFLIIFINFIFKIYGQIEPLRLLYKLGFVVGVTSAYYFPAYIFLIYIFWILFFLRSLSWRELMIPVVGLITPYIFLTVWYYCIDKLELVYNDYLNFFQKMEIINFEANYITIIILVIFTLLFVFSMMNLAVGKYFEKSISTRKKIKLSFSYLIISLIIIILYGGSVINFIALPAIPIAIIISFYFSELKRIYLLNLLTILLILIIIVNNYHLLDILNLE
ncbi:MAG: DUF6427 family protein [Bacteroidales bacterium]|nr:DUF6427 family protein [Bacteroidales bacterium]